MAADEKVYTIPLREAYKKARLKRAPYAAREVKKFIKTHTKAKEVKLGKHLNEEIWSRGIKKPPHKIRVKAVLDGDVAKAELMGFEYQDFKIQPKKERKGLQEKLLARMGQKALQKEAEEKTIEGKEKKAEEIAKESMPKASKHSEELKEISETTPKQSEVKEEKKE